MRILILSFLTIFLISCDQTPSTLTISKDSFNGANFIFYDKGSQDPLMHGELIKTNTTFTTNPNKRQYLIANGYQPTEFKPENALKPSIVKTAIVYTDKRILQSTTSTTSRSNPNEFPLLSYNLKILNAFLDTMNFGFTLEFKYAELPQNIKTDGKKNTDNIIADLKAINSFDDNAPLQIYLMKDSDFFNTANAIMIPYGDQSLIMGDAYLLSTPMLFIHELGHAMRLTHNNTLIDKLGGHSCANMFNVMHESNIGCIRGITARQLLIGHSEEYVQPIIMDSLSYFPLGNKDDCECQLGIDNFLTTQAFSYINSFDRNIDDTPLVGDHLQFLKLFNEIGTYWPLVETAVRENYDNEIDRYMPSLVGKNIYTDLRWFTHQKLMINNLVRWLSHNMEELGIESSRSNFTYVFNNFETCYYNDYLPAFAKNYNNTSKQHCPCCEEISAPSPQQEEESRVSSAYKEIWRTKITEVLDKHADRLDDLFMYRQNQNTFDFLSPREFTLPQYINQNALDPLQTLDFKIPKHLEQIINN